MKYALVIAATLAIRLLSDTDRVVIHDDPGGSIGEHVERFGLNRPVEIDGFCASACTTALWFEDTCVTPRATLLFHEASSALATGYMKENYPAPIKAWIDERGGLTRTPIGMSGEEAIRLGVKVCGRDGQ